MEKTKTHSNESVSRNAQELFLDAIRNGKEISAITIAYLTQGKQVPRYPLLGKLAGIIQKPGEEKTVSVEEINHAQFDETTGLTSIRFRNKSKFNQVAENYDPKSIQTMTIMSICEDKYRLTFPIQNIVKIQVKLI